MGMVMGGSLPAIETRDIRTITEGYYRKHLLSPNLDDKSSRELLRQLMHDLDPCRVVFLQSDFEELDRTFGSLLDDSLRRGDKMPFSFVFARFQERFSESLVSARQRLHCLESTSQISRVPSVDLASDWPLNELEREERWRIYLQAELTQLMQRSGQQTGRLASPVSTLHHRYRMRQAWFEQADSEDYLYLLANTIGRHLDPHSQYLDPRAVEDFHLLSGLKVDGLGVIFESRFGKTEVLDLIPGGPADMSGQISPGDVLRAMREGEGRWRMLEGLPTREVIAAVRGPAGSAVELLLARGDQIMTVTVPRERVSLEHRAARFYPYQSQPLDHMMGLLQVPSFYHDFRDTNTGRSVGKDILDLLAEANSAGVSGLVLDLRGNGGGSFREALDVAGHFLPGGSILRARNRKGQVRVMRDPEGEQAFAGPLVILVDERTASAAEIVAAGLQDRQRALVMGQHTYGKGTVQELVHLRQEELGAVRVTTQSLFRANGKSLAAAGVVPDLLWPASTGDRFTPPQVTWPPQIAQKRLRPMLSPDGLLSEGLRDRILPRLEKFVAHTTEAQALPRAVPPLTHLWVEPPPAWRDSFAHTKAPLPEEDALLQTAFQALLIWLDEEDKGSFSQELTSLTFWPVEEVMSASGPEETP